METNFFLDDFLYFVNVLALSYLNNINENDLLNGLRYFVWFETTRFSTIKELKIYCQRKNHKKTNQIFYQPKKKIKTNNTTKEILNNKKMWHLRM